mmetsp:Transcript_28680/g.42242  ORF Transcript_28680/g.42242 Transcript_28680/m.42242 type:complete len:595 (-) Transcript_28680:135-1919(-)
MGTYLSTPVVEKCQEEGSDDELAWGVVDMQGWRKSMEDAHVAQTEATFSDEQRQMAKVFGVFDGHGGPEVARFCQLYLVEVLAKQDIWGQEKQGITAATSTVDGAQDTSKSNPEDSPKSNSSMSPIGRGLIEAFHALDRMIDDRARRDELIRLRTEKPQPGERRTTGSIPIPAARPSQALEQVKLSPQKDPAPEQTNEPAPSPSPSPLEDEEQQTTSTESKSAVDEQAEEAADKPKDKSEDTPLKPQESASTEPPAEGSSPKANESQEIKANPSDEDSSKQEEDESENADDEADEPGTADDDSQEPVGAEEAAKLDQNLEADDDTQMTDETDSAGGTEQQRGVTVMLNKFMKIGSKGQVVGTLTSTGADTNGPTKQAPSSPRSQPAAAMGTIVPTIIRNGRQMCNLPDHPIHAGCTAVVAVKLGNTLTVANAGDSRAVLCRNGGVTEALSYDHKPQQEREMNRITTAGGFVNQFGRVNGNLNLSRSIGDLKYKQLPGLTPAEQMITAEPDILTVSLDPSDEFMILGCDGIWDCLTNEQAVKYVRDRIDSKTPTEIGTMLLDEIISEDPRHSQGIGGDNMTIMIVDFLPHTRPYR